jgi:hypothetical protein
MRAVVNGARGAKEALDRVGGDGGANGHIRHDCVKVQSAPNPFLIILIFLNRRICEW